MKLSTTIGFSGDPAKLAKRARDLESAGVDRFWGGEIYGFDLVSTLAYLAGKTERVQLMTGIMPLYSRSPALIAQTAATIDALSDGRFVLGLGTSGPQVIEGWHGVPFVKPLGRTRDTIEICRKVWSGEKVTMTASPTACRCRRRDGPRQADQVHEPAAAPTTSRSWSPPSDPRTSN